MNRIQNKQAITFLSLFFLCLLIYSCRGVDGAGLRRDITFNSAYRSLRLGAIQTANNRVAITLAIDTREVLVIMSPDPSDPSLADVLYRSSDGSVTQIEIDRRGRPRRAFLDSAMVQFTGYTSESVDTTIATSSMTFPSIPTEIRDEVRELLAFVREATTDDSNLEMLDVRNNFKLGIISTRTFGCSTSSASAANASDGMSTIPLAGAACGSELLTVMNNILTLDDFQERTLENFIGDPVACAFPRDDFDAAKKCIEDVSDEIIRESLLTAPDIAIVLDGTFDPETGDILPTPTPTPRPRPRPRPPGANIPPPDSPPLVQPDPDPEPDPDPAFFLGSYDGTVFNNMVDTFCPDQIFIELAVAQNGDVSCQSPACQILGNGEFNFPGFNLTLNEDITGSMNSAGQGSSTVNIEISNASFFDDYTFTFTAIENVGINVSYISDFGCEGSGTLSLQPM
jgi:hypothetical protein